MQQPYPDLEQMLAYVEGRLNAEEKAQIDRLLAEDKGFALELGEVELLSKSSKSSKKAISYHSQNVHQSISGLAKTKKRVIPPILLSIAAAVTILIVAGIWFSRLQAPHQDINEMLAWEASSSLRGGPTATALDSAINLGANGQWDESILSLEKILKESPSITEAGIYLSRAYMLNGRAPEGIAVLDSYISNNRLLPDQILEAKWFRGLAYVSEGDCSGAKEDLEWVVENAGNVRKKKARAILSTCP